MNAATKTLISASIPERTDELNGLWDEYSPQFNLTDDKPGFCLEAGPWGLVLFTYRTVEILWLLGFASWKAMYSYSTLLFSLQVSNGVFDMAQTNAISDQPDIDKEYDRVIDAIYELANIEDSSNFKWPDGVPTPTESRPPNDEYAVVFDLIWMATAYVFLHEIQHIRLRKDGVTLSSLDEEMECDKYARELMLVKIPEYSASSGYSIDKLKTKRGKGMCLAAFLLLVITPQELWRGSRSHPSLADRISAFTTFMELPDCDSMWNYLSCLLLSHMRYHKQAPNKISYSSYKDLCMQLIALLPS